MFINSLTMNFERQCTTKTVTLHGKKIIHAMYHTHALVFSQCSRTTPLYDYVLFLLNNFSINYLDMKVQDMSYHGIGYNL